ncbi:MAG: S24/S26 family peptidase [Clostridia bacterium]|nr:S24/S26 family peptidase [Clostridia bacterium]
MTPEGEKKRAILAEQGFYLTTPAGHSMEPMLTDREDQVLIRPLTGPARRGDVLLYETPAGLHALHRVVRRRPGGYLMRGDSCYDREPCLTEDRVIGRMETFWHGGRETSADDPAYRRYVRRRLLSYPLRRTLHALRALGARLTGHRRDRHDKDGHGRT